MKRYFSIILIILFVITINACKKKKEYTIAREGIINFIVGEVYIIAGDSKNKAEIGNVLKEGMAIETIGSKSVAEIYIGENAIKLLGNTKVKFEKLITNIKNNTEESVFMVENGKMFSKVVKKLAKGDKYEVKTPTAVASVRGTEFLVSQEKEKSNIACLDGMLEVLNQSVSGKPVVIKEKEEVYVEPGKDIVKQQISADKLRKLKILLEIKKMREDIRKRYEQQKKEILQKVVEQKEANKTMIEEQKEKDKALVEEQKKKDKELIENIKGQISEEKEKASKETLDAAKSSMEEAKSVDKESATSEATNKMSSMKPKIEKQKIDINKFKSTQ